MYTRLRQKIAATRLAQITIVYALGLIVYLFTTLPHNWWVFLTVMMMTAAIEPGLVVQKSINRGKGTLIGIILFIPLITLLQFNYRFIPLTFIILACLLFIPTAKRYDLTVIFMTMMVFMLTAYNYTTPLIEGPLEVTLNRAICTVVGVFICLGGDYILFKRFNYSRKLYYLLQRELCIILKQKVQYMLENENKNLLVVVEDLRTVLNTKFAEINNSATSLKYDLRSDKITKANVVQFETAMWKLRKDIYSIYYCQYVNKDAVKLQENVNRFYNSLHIAEKNFITYKEKTNPQHV